MTARVAAVLGTWGLPPDEPARIALVFAVAMAAFAFAPRSFLLREGATRAFLAITSGLAALLSILYVAAYLRGGPRIIDASTYFLQGRALADGHFAWTPGPGASASFRGRFLVYEGGHLGGIFPPGYPLLLAFGFAIGAPMIVGPLLAAALVVATYRLAKTLSGDEAVARAAALLSVVCAALRYHTADTMSHGAVALAVAIALDAALRKRAWIAWLAVGYVIATRPVSALPIGIVVLWLTRRPYRAVLGLLPGVVLLLAAQHAVTGAWLTSTQRLYYALSDGPPGCFKWGFGGDTGCVYEHGDFVHARLDGGWFGPLAALGTTARRLRHHLLDVANFEPLAFLVLVPFAKKRARAATALVALQVLAYVPFYFDGDYPGGGARFFADVLPVEHALVMFALSLWPRVSFDRLAHGALALALVGFGVHAAFEHDLLRDRDGGRPLFEPDVITKRGLNGALVFLDTDHGFDLAYDPSASSGVTYARLRDDDRDRMLYEALDRPETYKYRAEPGAALLIPWAPPSYRGSFEAEAEWPVLEQSAGFAAPGWSHACTSRKRALVLTPADGDAPATATFELPVVTAGTYELTVSVANTRIPFATTRNEQIAAGALEIEGVRFAWTTPESCADLPVQTVKLAPPAVRIRMTARGGPVSVDRFQLRSPGSR